MTNTQAVKTNTLVLFKGLPGCGKSTLAAALASPKTVIVNRDNLRYEMFGKWFDVPEGKVTVEQTKRVTEALKSGLNVIIDDTNLNPSIYASWVKLAKSLDVQVQTVDLTNVSVETCIARDLERKARGDRFVGEKVIRGMAERWMGK